MRAIDALVPATARAPFLSVLSASAAVRVANAAPGIAHPRMYPMPVIHGTPPVHAKGRRSPGGACRTVPASHWFQMVR
jgi:hypothetical protein